MMVVFFFQAEDGIRDIGVTGVQTCALPICSHSKFGFYECVNIKLVTWEPGLTRNFFWHPYDETLGKALRSTARILYGRNGQRLKALQEGAIPLTKLGGRLVRKPDR